MPEEIKWTVSAAIAGGPSIAQPGKTVVDAYDKVDVQVKKTTSRSVDLVPTATVVTNKVQFLMIISDYLDVKLTYSVKGTALAIPLDSIQLLMGGALALLPAVPTSLTFDNTNGAQDANIQILAGRMAVS